MNPLYVPRRGGRRKFWPSDEVHSADGQTYIRHGCEARWHVVIDGVHVATMWLREDARVLVRARKGGWS